MKSYLDECSYLSLSLCLCLSVSLSLSLCLCLSISLSLFLSFFLLYHHSLSGQTCFAQVPRTVRRLFQQILLIQPPIQSCTPIGLHYFRPILQIIFFCIFFLLIYYGCSFFIKSTIVSSFPQPCSLPPRRQVHSALCQLPSIIMSKMEKKRGYS